MERVFEYNAHRSTPPVGNPTPAVEKLGRRVDSRPPTVETSARTVAWSWTRGTGVSTRC